MRLRTRGDDQNHSGLRAIRGQSFGSARYIGEVPLGPAHATQQLTVVEKIAADKTKTGSVMLVRFVPFTRSPD
jgi:hypothetical protein